jgi:putative transcription factor
MSCEICGNDIRGRGIRVIVEGAKLTVCNDCAELGERVREEPRGRVTIKNAPTPQGKVKTTPPARQNPPPKPLPIRKAKPQASEESQEIVENYREVVKKARGTMTTDEFAASLNEKATVIQKIETGKLKPTLKLAKRIEKRYRVKLVNQRDAAEDLEDVLWKPEKKSDYSPSLGDFIKEKKE